MRPPVLSASAPVVNENLPLPATSCAFGQKTGGFHWLLTRRIFATWGNAFQVGCKRMQINEKLRILAGAPCEVARIGRFSLIVRADLSAVGFRRLASTAAFRKACDSASARRNVEFSTHVSQFLSCERAPRASFERRISRELADRLPGKQSLPLLKRGDSEGMRALCAFADRYPTALQPSLSSISRRFE